MGAPETKLMLMSGPYARLAPALLAQGFEPIPVRGKIPDTGYIPDTDPPVPVPWQSVKLTEERVTEWAANGRGNHSVGLRCGPVSAVDIDIYDPGVAQRVADAFTARFGAAPCRIGRAPKRLFLYVPKTPSTKLTSAGWTRPNPEEGEKENRVEVLGVGQQFVAYGIHPDTRKPYAWEGAGEPATAEVWELPLIDLDEVAAWLIDELPKLIPADWTRKTKEGNSAAVAVAGTLEDDEMGFVQLPVEGLTIEMAQQMVEKLDPSYADGYEEWRGVGMALHHQFGQTEDDEAAFELWDTWSQSCPTKYKAVACQTAWADGFKKERGNLQRVVTMASFKVWIGDEAWDEIWGSVRAQMRSSRISADGSEVVQALRSLPREEVLSRWVGMALDLPPLAEAKVVEEAARLSGERLPSLKNVLKQRKAEVARERKVAERQAKAHGREIISYDPTATSVQGADVERRILNKLAAEGRATEYVVFAGRVCEVAEERLPFSHGIDSPDPDAAPTVPTLSKLNRARLRARAEEVVFFLREERGVEKATEVPSSVLEWLEGGEHLAPTVAGLVTHPLVLLNGEILGARGVHACGLVVAGSAVPDCRPYTQAEAVEAIARIRASYCCGFEFATALDEAVALAALLGAVERKALDSAPGILVLAANQGTGKTTLARRLHVILTGRDLPTVTFPPNPEEARKTLLALLLASPAMVCFDNIPDGLTFRSESLAAIITSAIWSQRILGVSENVDVATNTTFVVTGNNLSLGRDELTRMLSIRLTTNTSAIGKREFKHPDVVGHALSNRAQILRDVVGIVSGYLKYGERIQPATRFQQWDRCVRQPLLWAGVTEDVAEVFDANEAASEERNATARGFQLLREAFGDGKFTARMVIDRLIEPFGQGVPGCDPGMAKDTLEGMGCGDPRKGRSVGRLLAAFKDRTADLPDGSGQYLTLVEVSTTGRAGVEYRIQQGLRSGH